MSEIVNKQLQKLIESYDDHCRQLEKRTQLKYSFSSPQEKKAHRDWLEEDYARWFGELFPQYAKSRARGFILKWLKY